MQATVKDILRVNSWEYDSICEPSNFTNFKI